MSAYSGSLQLFTAALNKKKPLQLFHAASSRCCRASHFAPLCMAHRPFENEFLRNMERRCLMKLPTAPSPPPSPPRNLFEVAGEYYFSNPEENLPKPLIIRLMDRWEEYVLKKLKKPEKSLVLQLLDWAYAFLTWYGKSPLYKYFPDSLLPIVLGLVVVAGAGTSAYYAYQSSYFSRLVALFAPVQLVFPSTPSSTPSYSLLFRMLQKFSEGARFWMLFVALYSISVWNNVTLLVVFAFAILVLLIHLVSVAKFHWR